MVTKRKSIWLSGLVVAGWASCPARAEPLDNTPAALLPMASYRLPGQTFAVPSASAPLPEYGALAELKTSAAVAMAKAGRATVIPGPDLSYRAGTRGPLVEIAALGGGMDKAPALAHVGFDWIF